MHAAERRPMLKALIGVGVLLTSFAALAKGPVVEALPCDASPSALAGFEFESVKTAVKDARAGRRLSELEKVARNVRFSSSQAGELLVLFKGGERAKAQTWLRSRLVDGESGALAQR